ncbi:pyridoxal kinase [Coccomyxa subellipsoidea C-169]|uniref:pyridoxal kinase n=1 Tax=Coccomyxa subellipsoidea (strain C-169) TaxID=574566 RepID=I0YQH2_COCSC|nr:pyridoxal kinase [Coccomyxa subellipsoidea C-169]EIE20641.1 pyridoxal kinase [Coccomyxa subellipsoidea C-169]|eukprot:XP_005645185.1 pyridoxal kinase [Coccomyxa subellipsoidea C-169]
MEATEPAKRVLSIQSHVVHGYVGNRCAVFPLQLLGYEVDFINSVQFSNHTGYPLWKGSIMDGDQLWEIVEGMKANGLLEYSHLVTGIRYIGSASLLQTVKRLVELLREHNPNLIYVCDPVMGDHGRLYVKPDLVPCYKEDIARLASIMTPNQFEAEQLVGQRIITEEDALAACQTLHSRGPSTVVRKFQPLEYCVTTLVSCQARSSKDCRLRLRVPRSAAYFTGTGDLMTVLLLAALDKQPRNLKGAVEKAVATLQAVLQATVKAAGQSAFTSERDAKVRHNSLRPQPLKCDLPMRHAKIHRVVNILIVRSAKCCVVIKCSD